MMRAANGNGKEVRVVSLSLFLSMSLAMGSMIGATATWAIAQQSERAVLAREVSEAVDKKLADFWRLIEEKEKAAAETHGRLSERIAEQNRALGATRERLDNYIDRHGGR